jgi:4-amino-4-deoxy-L-arabinose transferase-like glycosyltransferase
MAYAGLGAAILVGSLSRFWNLWGQSQFLDEAFTFDAAARPIHDLLVQIAYHDAHPPLFYLLTHWLMSLHLALTPEQYRSFTAPFGLLTIAATWGIVRRLFGDVPATVAALVVATEPSLVQLDRLYRMYALLGALTAASWWLLLAAQDAKGGARAAYATLYVLAAALLPSVQYLGGFVVASQVAHASFAAARNRLRLPVLGWTLAGAAAGAAALSWWVVWALPTQFRQGGYAGVASSTQTWWETPASALGYGLPAEWHHNPLFGVCFALAAALVLSAGVWIGRATILPWYMLPLGLQAAFSAMTGKDLVLSRYLVHLVPAFGASIGAITSKLTGARSRVAGVAVALCVLTVNGVAVTNELIDPVYQTPDWNFVGRIVARNAQPSDAIVLDDGYPYLILRSLPAFKHRAISAPTQAGQIGETLHWIDLRPGERVWYIENQFYYPDPHQLVLAHLSATRRRLAQWLEPRDDLSNSVYVALYGTVRGRSK